MKTLVVVGFIVAMGCAVTRSEVRSQAESTSVSQTDTVKIREDGAACVINPVSLRYQYMSGLAQDTLMPRILKKKGITKYTYFARNGSGHLRNEITGEIFRIGIYTTPAKPGNCFTTKIYLHSPDISHQDYERILKERT